MFEQPVFQLTVKGILYKVQYSRLSLFGEDDSDRVSESSSRVFKVVSALARGKFFLARVVNLLLAVGIESCH